MMIYILVRFVHFEFESSLHFNKDANVYAYISYLYIRCIILIQRTLCYVMVYMIKKVVTIVK